MAPASKQLRNRVPKQTCLQRRADVRARGGNSGYGQPKGGRNHSQVNDLWARFKVPEWGVFCHTERLRNSPLRLKLVLSDSAAERGEFEELKGFNNCQIYWWHDLLSLSETGIKFMNRYVGVLIILGTITGAFMSAGALAPAID